MGKSTTNEPFSIAMFVYQRVMGQAFDIWWFPINGNMMGKSLGNHGDMMIMGMS